jgi:hypothetical protein
MPRLWIETLAASIGCLVTELTTEMAILPNFGGAGVFWAQRHNPLTIKNETRFGIKGLDTALG